MESAKGIIVVDFDDTICLHETPDKSNILIGKPNVALISRLNMLYDRGFEIHIYTARGHLSCSSRDHARQKFEPIIKQYLNIYGAKYNVLSFNKPLATYYIDDKAVRPDELHILNDLIDS